MKRLPENQEGVIALIQNLRKDSILVHGIGMQAQVGLDNPTVEELEKGILSFSKLGIPVMITELDITVLPWPGTTVTADVGLTHEFKKEYDPYSQGVPDSISNQLNDKYFSFFEMFKKHSDKISRVTLFWGGK